MSTTTRTIEQILAIRLRAAQLRVTERAMALVKDETKAEQAWGSRDETERAKLVRALNLATQNVELAQREVDSQKGLPVERVEYASTSNFEIERYATVLMTDSAALGSPITMTAVEALDQAHADATARFEDWYGRYCQQDADENEA